MDCTVQYSCCRPMPAMSRYGSLRFALARSSLREDRLAVVPEEHWHAGAERMGQSHGDLRRFEGVLWWCGDG